MDFIGKFGEAPIGIMKRSNEVENKDAAWKALTGIFGVRTAVGRKERKPSIPSVLKKGLDEEERDEDSNGNYANGEEKHMKDSHHSRSSRKNWRVTLSEDASDVNGNHEAGKDEEGEQTNLLSAFGAESDNIILTKALESSASALEGLESVRRRLALLTKEKYFAKTPKSSTDEVNIRLLSKMAEIIMVLSKDSFSPAHRLNMNSISLHSAENMIRNPNESPATIADAIVRFPTPESSLNTLLKLRSVVEKAMETYNKIARLMVNDEMHDILLMLIHSLNGLRDTAKGAQEIFRVFFFKDATESIYLSEFLDTLGSVERSELLNDIQKLRRTIDEIPIVLEKLAWGSSIIFNMTLQKVERLNQTLCKRTYDNDEEEKNEAKGESSKSRTRERDRERESRYRHHQAAREEEKESLPTRSSNKGRDKDAKSRSSSKSHKESTREKSSKGVERESGRRKSRQKLRED